MFKSLVIGDLQLESKPSVLKKADTLFEIIESMNLPFVILLGDLLERRGLIEPGCLNYLFDKIRASPRHFIILNGNHDLINLKSPETALKPLKALPNVTLVDKPILLHGCAFIPYIHDLDELRKALKSFEGKTKVGFGHLDILGMDYGNGIRALHGIDVETIFSTFDTFISGHFHKYQMIKSGSKTFCYLGGPYSHDWGEANQDKYIATFDGNTLEPACTNETFPQHIKTEINCDVFTPEHDYLLDFNRVNYNRIVLKGTVEKIDEVKKYLLGSGFESTSIYELPTLEKIEERLLTDTMSIEEQFVVYGEQIAKLTEDVIRSGLEILEEVS